MPYISTTRVKEIREKLKKEFPSKEGWKFSVTIHNYSMVRVAVLTSPIKMTDKEDGHESVNHYYIAEHFKDRPEVGEKLKKISEILNEGQGLESTDSDYGNIPNFYVSLSIGQWDRPFVMAQR